MTLMRPGIRRGSETMVDLVRRHAESRPERIAHAFMAEQESAPIEQLDYQELVRRAATVAAALDRWVAARPELPRMALLVFPAGPGDRKSGEVGKGVGRRLDLGGLRLN